MKSQPKTNIQINSIFNTLSDYYGVSILRKGWRGDLSWWQAESGFELMTGSILVQNTNWKNVDKALKNFNGNLSPQLVLSLSNEELAGTIRPAGFQNQKAKKLKALCEWFKKYDFNIEKASGVNKETLRKELLSVNGVGNETADAILVYVLGKNSFVIDAYTRRIFIRIGFDVPKKYDQFREMIEKAVPRNIFTYDYYHGLMVEHAKTYCTQTPGCEGCPLFKQCEKKQ